MEPVEAYLTELRDTRSTGSAVAETSYYHALQRLLNEIGKDLKPKVKCIMSLSNRGAGLPDGGLFTADQFQKSGEPLPGQIPARGVIEVKPVRSELQIVSESEQVARYWGKYRQVLVTNYRNFCLIGQNENGEMLELESYSLADNDINFWTQIMHPRKMAEEHKERFPEYLKRVMMHAAPIASPEDVAWFLASYARDAKVRIEKTDLPALLPIREALEEALGLKFEGEKGDHFFRSTFIQTLFYGVFSAWVLWHQENPTRTDKFDWKSASHYLNVPMIQILFEQLSAHSKVKPLGLIEVLDWASLVLNRVDRIQFFDVFEQ